MEKLYLETKNGKIPIGREEIKKMNLKKGEISPFTRNRIVDKNGEYTVDPPIEENSADLGLDQKEDGTVEIDKDVLFSTSEIIDLSHGEDSSTET